jgi:hypothetical protein
MVILAAAGLAGTDSDLAVLSIELIFLKNFGMIDLVDAGQNGYAAKNLFRSEWFGIKENRQNG